MKRLSDKELQTRIAFENPWWRTGTIDPVVNAYPRRAYYDRFLALVERRNPNRAVILMGPRRVGKTVMAHHAIGGLLSSGVPREQILYLSLDTPLYSGFDLDHLLGLFHLRFGHQRDAEVFVVFDEIQYFRDWERHLKSLVDSYPTHRFVGSGSAAAALRLKSQESGAGRFTDFFLPPLTFSEYLSFVGRDEELVEERTLSQNVTETSSPNLAALNEEFVNYLNYGGYPEAVMSPAVRADSSRFIRSDIIDKVLLRDLPSLYGILDIQELNRLFTSIVYNTAGEISLDNLSTDSGVAKNTIKRYIEYLEAAFLIRRLNRVDQNARSFKRARQFKAYVTNCAMRGALFGYVGADHADMGALAESAIIGQWMNSESDNALYYARWKGGEVDLVAQPGLGPKVSWILEVKWTDSPVSDWREIQGVLDFARRNRLPNATVTTRTVSRRVLINDVSIHFKPTAVLCYELGKNLASGGAGVVATA